VKPDARVGIFVERGLEMVVGLLAILKAGERYVPLDPAYPVERVANMLEDSALVVLLTQRHLKELLGGIRESLPVLDLTDAIRVESAAETDMDSSCHGSYSRALGICDLHLRIHGPAKGVMVQHVNVARLFSATNERFPV